MSWMEMLYRTYENNEAEHMGDLTEKTPLLPLCHSQQNAHVHVTLDASGKLRNASVVPKVEANGIIPVTEESAGRAGAKIAPHPLFDKLQYVAGDYVAYGGAENRHGFKEYIEQLNGWCDSEFGHPKVRAVRDYLDKKTLIGDLIKYGVFHVGEDGKLRENWTDREFEPPEIFSVLPSKDQREAFVRFSVESPSDPQSELWTDKKVWTSWIGYFLETFNAKIGMCYITGENVPLATNHPKRIRNGGDGAKLISSNDSTEFTFRGKFIDAAQAYGVAFEVTQKAHSALRWLVGRQGIIDQGLAVVAWVVSGKEIPDPWADTAVLLGEVPQEDSGVADSDAGQVVGRRLAKKIAGYRADLGDTSQVVVMALDSATPGRMAIKYYRELTGSEYLHRIERWHRECAWEQSYGKAKRFVGAPSPKMIAMAAYGASVDDRLRKATVERLLPCIVDGVPIYRDLVDSCVRRASNRVGQDPWEWEMTLGVACALYRYFNKGEHDMALETGRTTRDYLYGRLLAVADHIEQSALTDAERKRSTSAARFMQRFADRPYSTWRSIELGLRPYQDRLEANKFGLAKHLDKELQDIFALFDADDFCNDSALTGEFLLGFHCQKSALWTKKADVNQ